MASSILRHAVVGDGGSCGGSLYNDITPILQVGRVEELVGACEVIRLNFQCSGKLTWVKATLSGALSPDGMVNGSEVRILNPEPMVLVIVVPELLIWTLAVAALGLIG